MADPKVIYLLGDPVSHSLSPIFQNAALEALGLPWKYLERRVEGEDLDETMRRLHTPGIAGANITVPHKVSAISFIDIPDPGVVMTGAVNTVVVQKEGLAGYNTDIDGFLLALDKVEPEGLMHSGVVLMGAGGAARAVAGGIVREGRADNLIIVSRNRNKGLHLIETIVSGGRPHNNPVGMSLIEDADEIDIRTRESVGMIVNATPLGMGELAGETPLDDLSGFPSETLVFDLVYRPAPTKLLHDAARRGMPTEDGLNMLLYQGALSLKFWTGCEPPLEVMRMALHGAVEQLEGGAG